MTHDRSTALPLPPKPRRAPKLYKHPRTGYYSSLFYDPTQRPVRKWFALQTDQKRRAMKLHQEADASWFAGTFDPWRSTAALASTAEYVSVTDAVRLYVEAQKASGKWRATTASDRQRGLERFAASLPAGISPARVTEADIRAHVFAAPLKGAPHKRSETARQAGTHRTYLALIKPFFDWCVARGYAGANPSAGIEAPRVGRKPVGYLEPAEFERLVAEVRKDYNVKISLGKLHVPNPRQILWLADVFELAVYTGLRRGELVRLRWRDVALEAQAGPTLYVRNTAKGQTKTGDERPVPLVGPAVELLQRLAAERPNEDRDAPVLLSPDWRHGPKPIVGGSAASGFRTYADAAGIAPELSFHALRKTCATWLLNSGVEMVVVQRILGHSSIRTTESVYATVLDRTVRTQMESAFGQHTANKNSFTAERAWSEASVDPLI